MSHDTTHAPADKPKASSTAAFFAVLIFIGFILGLINFTQSMSHDEPGHGSGSHTEQHGETHKEAGAPGHH